MLELIATVIFLASLCGITVVLYRKAPVLAQLPNSRNRAVRRSLIVRIEEGASEFYSLFLKQKILHRSLSWLRIMALRAESKLDSLLHGLRKSAKERKINTRK